MTPPQSPPDDQDGPRMLREDGFDLFMSRAIRVCGLAIALYETAWESTDRPGILGVAMFMMTGSLAYDAIRRKLAA